jgi:hypothetical protein
MKRMMGYLLVVTIGFGALGLVGCAVNPGYQGAYVAPHYYRPNVNWGWGWHRHSRHGWR